MGCVAYVALSALRFPMFKPSGSTTIAAQQSAGAVGAVKVPSAAAQRWSLAGALNGHGRGIARSDRRC